MKRLWAVCLILLAGCSACATTDAAQPEIVAATPSDKAPDAGFIEDETCGGMWWAQERLPLKVVIHPSAQNWEAHVRMAADWWGPQYLKVVDEGAARRGEIDPDIVVISDASMVDMAVMMPDLNLMNCETARALIVFPLDLVGQASAQMAAHEFGHALGLDHDEGRPDSVMYPIAHGGPFIALPGDRERLRQRYSGPWTCEPR